MERNDTASYEVKRNDKSDRTLGRLAARFTAMLRHGHSLALEQRGGAVIYQGSGAPLLPDGHGISSKEQSDAVVAELLGRV